MVLQPLAKLAVPAALAVMPIYPPLPLPLVPIQPQFPTLGLRKLWYWLPLIVKSCVSSWDTGTWSGIAI